ncbi:MAG: HepT-like ribonuclease domain-containing protein [Candidatus Falkowbacteria bacterium]
MKINKPKNDTEYLNHIWGAINKIKKYLNGFDYKKFKKNDLVKDAVERELITIGEAIRSH